MLWMNKKLENKIKELDNLVSENKALVETIRAYHNNGACLLLEDLNEVVISKLQSLTQDNNVIILFTKRGDRIEIHKQSTDNLVPRKRKVLF